MKNQASHTARTQAGNALFFILICIALFAALGWAVAQGFRSSGSISSMTEQQAKLLAGELIDKSEQIRRTVSTLMINGCTDTQISFERAPFDGSDSIYDNPNSPANFSCHVFHPKGGGLSAGAPNSAILKGTPGLDSRFVNQYFFTAKACVGNVGTSGASATCWNNGTNNDVELLLIAADIKDDVCLQINSMANFNKIPLMGAGNGNFFDYANSEFKGVYGEGGTTSGHIYIDDPDDRAALENPGRRFLCYRDGTPDVNVFYYVVIAR